LFFRGSRVVFREPFLDSSTVSDKLSE
jgi:hypothetical protein